MNTVRCLVFLLGVLILLSNKAETQGTGLGNYCCCYPTSTGTPQCLSGDAQLCCSHAGGHSAPSCDSMHCWGVNMTGNYATDKPTQGCTPTPSWSKSCVEYNLEKSSVKNQKEQVPHSKK